MLQNWKGNQKKQHADFQTQITHAGADIRIQKRGRCQIEQKRGGSGQTHGKEQINDLEHKFLLMLFLQSSNVTQIAAL